MTTLVVTGSQPDAHDLPGHPEHAGRLQAVRRRLGEDGLLERVRSESLRPVDPSLLGAVHTPQHLDQLQATARLPGSRMLEPDTYATPRSYEIACLAAGGTVRAVEAVLAGEARNAAALIRPPGHHATRSRAMGFCLINNVAVAARHALRVQGVERVAIVDYDVHHGNGTQDIFYDDPAILYLSTHQSPLYPGTGSMTETGRGAGWGFTLNVPLPPGVGDEGFWQVFCAVVLPALDRFRPDLVLVSLGFDAHWADPLANLALSLSGYDRLARCLIEGAETWCAGRIVFVMEGGYDLEVLSCGWANLIRALLGDEGAADPLGSARGWTPDVRPIIEELRYIHGLP
ncbi:MAG: histone deacetylase [Anaerolineae bacterium]|nr:histone deacetylase [Anaerolineae bacterium]